MLKAFDCDFKGMERVRLMLSPERLQWIDAAMKGASKIRNENILLEVWCKGETLQPGRMHQRTPNAEWRKCVSAIVRRRNFAATRGTPPKPERAKFGGEAWFVWSLTYYFLHDSCFEAYLVKIMLNCLRSKIMILNGKINKTYSHGEVFF